MHCHFNEITGLNSNPIAPMLKKKRPHERASFRWRRGQDSNLQPLTGDGFQDRLTATVHPSEWLRI